MDILGVSTSEPLEVKWQCENCPRLRTIQGKLDKIDKQKANIGALAQDPRLEQLVQGSSVSAVTFSNGETIEASGSGEEAIAMMRSGAASYIDHLDEHEQECRDEGKTLQNNCPGVTDLHARDLIGRTVIVRVCGSPVAGSLGIEDAHVTRTSDELPK